jgi:putative DNA primase/helicase
MEAQKKAPGPAATDTGAKSKSHRCPSLSQNGTQGHEDAFRQAIERVGLTPPTTIIADGKFHRFPTNDKHGDTAGWYVLSPHGVPAGCFGDWRTDVHQTWCAKAEQAMTDKERTAHRKRIEAIRREREEAEERAAEQAHAIWREGRKAATDHPYLLRKQIKAHGVRVELATQRLIVPIRNEFGSIQSVQFIPADPNGKKMFLKDSTVARGYFTFGEDNRDVSRLVIGEGFATCASVFEATGFPVFAALSASNLLAVARIIRGMYPKSVLIIAGDHDHSGTGQREAKTAADTVHGVAVIPETEGDDWNDVHVRDGLNAVKLAIETIVEQKDRKATAAPYLDLLDGPDSSPVPRLPQTFEMVN